MAAMLMGLPSRSLTLSSWVSKLWTLTETLLPVVDVEARGHDDDRGDAEGPGDDPRHHPRVDVVGVGARVHDSEHQHGHGSGEEQQEQEGHQEGGARPD